MRFVAPENAPSWAQDRAALWNAAEDRETRRNSVTAREWELALPSEVSDSERAGIARDFAQELVTRYGVAADVAIHAPHREGDQRNYHAHILTTTRRLEPDGFTDKTRVLDAAKTGGVEIEELRGVWANMQNQALEWAGEVERVDHRSLEAQREAAQERGDEMKAEELDRDPELKLGPAANSMERREKQAAEREGREYVPVTERGAVVHAARQARAAFQEMRERLDVARETYGLARDEGQGRASAGLAALRAAAGKDGRETSSEDINDRLAQIVECDQGKDAPDQTEPSEEKRESVKDRLRSLLDRSKPVQIDKGQDDRELDEGQENERDIGQDTDRGEGHSL